MEIELYKILIKQSMQIKKAYIIFMHAFEIRFLKNAESEGFEPSIQFPIYTLSKRAPSATRTTLQFIVDGKCTCLDLFKVINLKSFPYACF